MDTLNVPNIDASSTAMGTSETHSEKATSDEEDYKLNIPYYESDGINGNGIDMDYIHLQEQQTSPTTSSNHETMQQNSDEIDVNQLNYANWDNDELIGSDFSSPSASENLNLFTTPGPPPPTASSSSSMYFNDPNATEIKYSQPELLMQPPNRYHSTMQFEMQLTTQQQRRHLQPLPTPSHLQHVHVPLQHRHHHQQALRHTHFGGGRDIPFHHNEHTNIPHAFHQQTQQQTTTPTFHHHHHPNMWHPNAPYGANRYSNEPQRYPYHYNAGYGHDPMMDMLQLSNSSREARNRAEKNRRDKLNGSIQELSTMVPHVAESPRRVDKTAVLRFAAHGLRLKYVFGESLQQERTQITEPLMKLLDSFFITLTCSGQIVLISSSIEQHLGHCQADLYGQNILHITHPEDHSMLKNQLIPKDLENLFDAQVDDDASETRTRTQAEEELTDKKLREDKRSFTVRLARAGPRSEPTSYEVVRIDGCFRRSDAAPRGVKNNPFPTSLQLMRRSRGRDDSLPLHMISGNDIVLIAVARIIRPPKVSSKIIESNNLEYKTRHLIDGRIIDCDQRIGLVAGYMTDEIRNLSPFTFMHQDDVRWVIVALRQMYDCNSSYGESTYRLLSRNGNFIYLQSRGYLEIDKNTNKVHSFICINTLLSEEEGKRRVQEMKRKFSIIINKQIPPTSIDAPASENPQQLEKAVLRLIQDLQKSSDDEENYEHNGERKHGSSHGIHKMPIEHSTSIHHLIDGNKPMSLGSSKTPPLALVPPETASVKSSISKSVSVVNVTAARSLRGNQRLKSPLSTTEDDYDDDDIGELLLGHKYHIGTSPPNLMPSCTCHRNQNNGGSELCDYCRQNNYVQQFPANRTAQKHKLSCSQSSDGDDVVPQKRILQDTIQGSIKLISPAQSDQSEESVVNEVSEQSEKSDYSNPGSSERTEEQRNPANIFVDLKKDFEIEIDISQNKNNSTTNQLNFKDYNVNQR